MKCFTSYLINHVILPLLTPGSQNINILLMEENLLSYIHVAKDISKLLIIALNFFLHRYTSNDFTKSKKTCFLSINKRSVLRFQYCTQFKSVPSEQILHFVKAVSQLFRCFIINLMLEDR